jgi:hypothetical protein
MVPYKVYVLFVDQKYTREKEVSKRVCPYIWVLSIYCSFVFDEDLLMHFLRKIPFRNYVTINTVCDIKGGEV